MTAAAWRPWFVWLVSSAALLGALLLLAYGTGWPRTPDGCVATGCYCEAFDLAHVEAGARGIRQPTNTWSNLYALFTAGLVALLLTLDRRNGASGASGNVMRSNSWIADAYVFAVLFLGLGSMWLHASIAAAVSWMDGFSMYVFAAFLVFYTLDRGLARKAVSSRTRSLVFWIGYPATAITLTIIGAIGVDSLILIAILVAAYLGLEIFLAGFVDDKWAMIFWVIGVAAMENAVLFWVLSKTGGPLCNPSSWFQPHGLLWHPLAGVMAVMMFLYWRRERSDAGWS